MLRRGVANWLINCMVNMVILMTLAGYLHSMVHISGIGAAFGASIVLSLLNTFVRPILIFFSLPATILTFGFFIFIINALLLLLTADIMGSSFQLDGFSSALIVAVIMAVCQIIVHALIIKPLRQS
ncbi:MAG: phage holin family protein [Sporolactobacillus sp.]